MSSEYNNSMLIERKVWTIPLVRLFMTDLYQSLKQESDTVGQQCVPRKKRDYR
jgi:hypothetical protein